MEKYEYKYELLVMGFLLDRPMHGYQINREAKKHRMDSWANIYAPMVYKTVTKLEKDGMIKNSKVEREGRMPERRIYRLTSRGKERLAQLVEKSLKDRNLTYDLSSLGYFFIVALPKERALECLNQRKSLAERTIKSLNERRAEFKGKTPINRLLVLEKDVDRFKSELSHLKKLIKRVTNCTEWSAQAFM